jgi:lipopolysaccharide/colanic/teichoic acid biosynthesis glycosyltransferase
MHAAMVHIAEPMEFQPGVQLASMPALTGARGGPRRLGYGQHVKPVVDVVGALVLLLLSVPLLACVALAVRLQLGPGVIFRQARVGRHGRPFVMFKFRTMLPDRRKAAQPYDGPDRRVCHKREDDPRHTRFGQFLRRTRLDELPQLLNIVKGDMSLVGPRPELVEVVKRYDDWQHARHTVKPGLTGFWQTSDRATGLACDGVDLDLEYVDRVSFLTDCRILLRTIPVALRRTGR